MDMTPPQAPPALTQTTQQEAVAALQRLTATQHWLTEQEAMLPPLPDTRTSTRYHTFLAALVTFWEAPVVPSPGAAPVSRWDAFVRRFADVMRDDATLRYLDGTLDADAKELATTFARTVDGALDPRIHAYALTLGGLPYAGAVVLTDERAVDLTLLFLPDRGWERFPDRATLHRVVEARIRQRLATDEAALPGIMADDLAAALDSSFVDSREWGEAPFIHVANRIIALQQEKIEAVWPGIAATVNADAAVRYLSDRVAPLLRLHTNLDVHAILEARDRELVTAIERQRLSGVPADVAKAWRAARDTDAVTMRLLERRRLDAGLGEVTPLDDFVREGLRERLKALGVDAEPDDVVMDAYDFTRAYYYNPTGRPNTSFLGPVRERLSLKQLALRNVSALDDRILIPRHDDGRERTDVSGTSLKAMVRELDVATRYREHLTDVMSTSPSGTSNRALTAQVRAARMRFDAEDARLGYFLPDEPKSFADDHAFRGYRWVDAVLDAPEAARRRPVDGHDVVVRQLTYKDAPVSDVLVIGAGTGESVSRIVLYTPGAPDGIAFREFDSRADAARRFLNQPAFETYLLDRLPAEFSRTDASSRRRFALSDGERRFRWVFNLGDANVPTPSPSFEERVVTGNVFDTAYDTELSLVIRDLHAIARPTAHADADHFTPNVDVDALGHAIARLIGRPFQAGWRAYERVKESDHAQAFVDATDAYVASLDFLAVGALRPLLARAMPVRVGRTGTRLVDAGQRPPDPSSIFDERFVARDVSLRQADAVHDGVYRLRGRHYIENDGKVYGVRREGQTWRLTHRDSPTYAPHIRRNARGGWEYVGLRGGLAPLPFRWPYPPNDNVYGRLTFHQRMVFEQTLIARTSEAEARHIVRHMADDPLNALTTRLTAEQQNHWRVALRTAQSAPVERPRPIASTSTAQAGGAAALPNPSPWTPPAILEELPTDRWPDTLWYYPSGRDPFPTRTEQHLILAQSRHNAAGTLGVGGVAVEPRAPWATLNATLGGPTLVPGRWPLVFEWVSLNLRALRTRRDAQGGPGFRVFLVRNGSEVNYLVREAGAQGDLPHLWLRQGEFDTGIRFLSMADVDGAVPGPSRAPNPPGP